MVIGVRLEGQVDLRNRTIDAAQVLIQHGDRFGRKIRAVEVENRNDGNRANYWGAL